MTGKYVSPLVYRDNGIYGYPVSIIPMGRIPLLE
jgi:hypothetical protein